MDLLQEMAIARIEEILIENVKYECQCSFSRDGFQNSTIKCRNKELTYATTLEYSNDDGSETASVIATRIVGQVPFSVAVGGAHLRVTSACIDCEMPTEEAGPLMLSPAVGGGLFVGGFAAAVFIIITLMIIVYVSIYTIKLDPNSSSRHIIITIVQAKT